MKYTSFLCFILLPFFFGCNQETNSNTLSKTNTKTIKPSIQSNKDEIRTLIRQMLKWADSKSTIHLLPILSKDSICIGFDFDKLHQNLEILKKTGFFANEFIDNYSQIIHTLDKKIKNNEFDKWNVYELPSFNFDNDVDPWCLCQDNLSWDNIEIEVLKLDNNNGELKWNWGKLDSGTDRSWKEFSYTFRVVKVDSKWKISYLQGFDLEDSIK